MTPTAVRDASDWTPRIISAAAGSGKTTRLVQEYLRLLKRGFEPSSIITITFTRAAAAELIERVALTLRARLGDVEALRRLGDTYERCYRADAPGDERSARNALRGLLNAPAGTTDSFVQSLLSEFAVHAGLPVEDGSSALLDVPVGLGDSAQVFKVAARSVVDPSDGQVPEEAKRCLAHLTLGELLNRVVALASSPPQGRLISVRELMPRIRGWAGSAFFEARSAEIGVGKLRGCRDDDQKQEIERWAQSAGSLPVPHALVSWMGERLSAKAKDVEALKTALRAQGPLELGVVQLSAEPAVRAMAHWTSEDAVAQADRLRRDLMTLAHRTRQVALVQAAKSGALDYELLTEAAIHLCSHDPPARLRRRFKALLVDEMQDANPAQMRLYRALATLPGNGEKLETVMVGDLRQSIFLFRGAEPRNFEELVQQAERAGCLDCLNTNFRSTPELIDAQKALFAAASRDAAPDSPGLEGVGSIDEVTSDPTKARNRLGSAQPWPEPVVIAIEDHEITPPRWKAGDADAAALDLFAKRLVAAWSPPDEGGEGRPADTAAVLCSTWRSAKMARDRLRVLLGNAGGERAFLDGSRDLLGGRVAADVRVLLKALWDTSNRLAWAALWKLPFVGLTDGALVLLDAGVGLLAEETAPGGEDDQTADIALDDEISGGTLEEPSTRRSIGDRRESQSSPRMARTSDAAEERGSGAESSETREAMASRRRGLAAAVHAGSLDADAFCPGDVSAFARVKRPLIRALGRIGRQPTADVLEDLATALHWRAILLAGPDGEDAVAQLEVLLDWIRQAEQSGVDPDRLIDSLDPERSGEELPRLNLDRGPRTVSCTTVYQAKGLAWDHVCILGIGTSPQGGSGKSPERAEVVFDRGQAQLLGVQLDPDGGITPRMDPMGILSRAVWAKRRGEERLRLAYVAITRAARSVTFGLARGDKGLRGDLYQRWTSSGLAGVHLEEMQAPAPLKLLSAGHATARAPFRIVPPRPDTWQLVAPSTAHERWTEEERSRLADDIAARCTVHHGGPLMALPHTDWDLDRRDRGSLVHAWMGDRGLIRGASIEDALDFLARHSSSDDRAIGEWLVRISHALFERQPELVEALTEPGAKVLFEVPFVGIDEGEPDRVEALTELGVEVFSEVPSVSVDERRPEPVEAPVAHGAGASSQAPFAVGEPSSFAGQASGSVAAELGRRRPGIADAAPGRRKLYSGSIDLLLLRPDGKVWIIDFKGMDNPTGRSDVRKAAKLEIYGPQLEAYRRSLQRTGYTVERLGLLFMGACTWVEWA